MVDVDTLLLIQKEKVDSKIFCSTILLKACQQILPYSVTIQTIAIISKICLSQVHTIKGKNLVSPPNLLSFILEENKSKTKQIRRDS